MGKSTDEATQPDAPEDGAALRVKPVGVEAFKVIAALYAGAFDDPWPEPSVRELMATPGVWALIALDGDQPVGFVLARVVAREGEVLAIGVPPVHRRGGIARTLMTRALDVAKTHADAFFLEVGEDNPGALGLYLDLSFKPVGVRRGYYRRADGTRVDAKIMRYDFLP
jgi:ribosomal-protein-alanine N-acetyltransferase